MSYVTNLAAGIGRHAAQAGLGSVVGQYASKRPKPSPANVGKTAGQYAAQTGIGSKLGAAAAHPAPAPSVGTPPMLAPAGTLAGDPSLLAGEDAAQRARATADANATFATGQLDATYGLTPGGGVDLNNPFGLAALLQHSHDQSLAGNKTSYASQGQLYSGALQNAQDAEARNYAQGQDQLFKGYQGAAGKIALEKAAGYSSAADSQQNAVLAALLAALNGTS